MGALALARSTQLILFSWANCIAEDSKRFCSALRCQSDPIIKTTDKTIPILCHPPKRIFNHPHEIKYLIFAISYRYCVF